LAGDRTALQSITVEDGGSIGALLLSMTGHGEAQRQREGVVVVAEVRTVNNRFLKVSIRASDGYSSLEPQIEATVRRYVRRGSVMVNVRVDRAPSPDDFRLNEVVLTSYYRQLKELSGAADLPDSIRLEPLLALPGVVTETGAGPVDLDAVWPLVEEALVAALENLSRMRTEEGGAMARDLHANCGVIMEQLDRVEERAPLVVESYRRRLTERLNKLLEEYEVSIEPADIVREVGMFADRSDISEEIVRLRSHLEQFQAIARNEDSGGRKLEFIIQEMLRETNTIGSKANDAEIARFVVEIKAAIERMREMIQNVE
jgi:uncharacterized protein (TIGR00255 family)